jgi:hypothetical protein
MSQNYGVLCDACVLQLTSVYIADLYSVVKLQARKVDIVEMFCTLEL